MLSFSLQLKQGIGGQIADNPPILPKTKSNHTHLVSKQLLGGLYHSFQKVA